MLLQSLQNSMKHMQTECRERRQELHLDADAASVISGRVGKPDFVKPSSTCVAQIVGT